ncbi:hypothetical protein LOK49_Contig100G00007 [Camellia lanceoleosa]|nr:hypothetical protein LOK49_Contig100G00007 [Camellia lanceoleosa]
MPNLVPIGWGFGRGRVGGCCSCYIHSMLREVIFLTSTRKRLMLKRKNKRPQNSLQQSSQELDLPVGKF